MTLEIITHDLLEGHKHGFFTRKGGVSKGVYKGLNCGLGSNDNRDSVLSNREIVTKEMDINSENLRTVYQIHSADVLVESSKPITAPLKADAMVTNIPGVALGIFTADCAPLLFSDPVNNIVGAAHSGWKGAISGIGSETLRAMEKLGADRKEIRAVVGPCISQMNYEVGEEFLEEFLTVSHEYMRFFANGAPQKYQFDLPGFCLFTLREAGLHSAQWTGHCTYRDEDRFYSYRRMTHRSEKDYGRLISVIRA